MSIFGPLIILGVFSATLSSALGSFLGAPRILQAMGRDGLMKILMFFGKGAGPSDEPQRATILTFIIAMSIIWAGDLNAIAEIISMFFLIAYGTINLSAFVESKGGNPSFRPKFKFFHWSIALIGAIGCAIVMMKINDTYALIALFISTLIYFYLKKQDIKTNFGDAKRGYIFRGVRNGLNLLQGTKSHPKNWRPILVAITDDASANHALIRAGSWIESGRGLYTIVSLQECPLETFSKRIALRETQLSALNDIKKTEHINAFTESLITHNFHEGLFDFLQCHSIGALKANTILLALPSPSDQKAREKFFKTLDIVTSFNHNLIIFKPGEIKLNKKKRIDLWWRGETNGSLMALFSYLITLSHDWSGSKIRLLRSVHEGEKS